ncbi:MAG: hypothetical protein ACRD3P_19330 [Terriglobales bacterium]
MTRKKKPKTAIILRNTSAFALRTLILACLTLFPTINNPLHGREKSRPPDYALIFGTVWGPDDRPVYGVEVKIRVAGENKAHWKVSSNRLGEFEQRVPAGKQDYVLWPDLKGYKNPAYKHLQPGPEVTVHIERDERVDTGVHLQ